MSLEELIPEVGTSDVTIQKAVVGERENTRSVSDMYLPTNSTVYLSHERREQLLNEDSRERVKRALEKSNRPELYEGFLLVAAAAEEFAHFVDHTRGKLSLTDEPALPSASQELQIQSYGVDLSDEQRKLINAVMRKVFEVMAYSGNPPQAFVYVDGEILLNKENETPEQKSYFESGAKSEHYNIYDFEQRAKSVKKQVLEWWFRQVEGLEYYFSL